MRGIDASDPRVGYPEFVVEEVWYRPLLDPMREALQGERFFKMHLTPFAYRYDPYHNDIPDDSIRNIPPPPPPPANTAGDVFGELYTARAFLEAYNAIPQPPPPASADDPVESIVVAFMSFSDETQAAQFGSASIWPEYIYYGNDSKYRRAKPPENCGFHQAYFAKLPDEIFDAYRKAHGCDMPDEVYTHLKRELIHAIWERMLSDDFMDAKSSALTASFDLYFRVSSFTVPTTPKSTVLLATIMSMGGCPCPRCFVQKKLIGNTGTDADMRQRQKIRIDDHPRRFTIEDARRAIFANRSAIQGTSVDKMLKKQSWIPTRNAFSKLRYRQDTVQPLQHAIIIHLIRMLDAFGTMRQFDERLLPETMRTFFSVFFPSLRVYSLSTSNFVDRLMFELAARTRPRRSGCFAARRPSSARQSDSSPTRQKASRRSSCRAEQERRAKKATTKSKAKAAAAAAAAASNDQPQPPPPPSETTTQPSKSSRKGKQRDPGEKLRKAVQPHHLQVPFLTRLPRHHRTIRHHPYSTQIGELAHRLVKYFYRRTNKRGFTAQIAKQERRRRLMRAMWERRKRALSNLPETAKKTNSNSVAGPTTQKKRKAQRLRKELVPDEPLALYVQRDEDSHHHISDSQRAYWRLEDIIDSTLDDSDSDDDGRRRQNTRIDLNPNRSTLHLSQDFIAKAKSHILRRLCNLKDDDPITQQQHANLIIQGDRFYTHATMRVNYNTYDLRRDQDVVNPRTRRFVMLHSPDDNEDTHPFLYACVLGIFHAKVLLADSNEPAQIMQFLWVRWLQRSVAWDCGLERKRFPSVHYVSHEDPDAFGFIDPADVVRGAHLIPAFAWGRTKKYLPTSFIRRDCDDKGDWAYHFVNMVVDRDMLMRFHENVIGHQRPAKKAPTSTFEPGPVSSSSAQAQHNPPPAPAELEGRG
ncbi:hypothetical protein MKEN_01466400 [Mycena kentingensis (nom. inval.)]|nr:hypothetical protein MKEN_01466400 [Mycena kentingensis (nom. inval.)]